MKMKSTNKKARRFISIMAAVLLLAAVMVFPCSAATARDATSSVVMVYEQFQKADSNGQPVKAAAWGSGFAIGTVGKPVQYIVTNYHVVKDAYESGGIVQVYFSAAANKYVQAEVYWKNADKDLAILKLPEPTTERKAMVLCPMSKVNMDDSFSALGYPGSAMAGNDFPKFDEEDIVITKGGISKQTRVDETDCYLLDIQISEGNSGGPLVNSKGEVVGINSFYIQTKASANAATVKSSYAVAIDELIRNIDRSVIPITVAGEVTQVTIIYIASAAVGVVIILVIVLLIIGKNKKKKAQTPAQVPAAAYVPAPAVAAAAQGGFSQYQPTVAKSAIAVTVTGLSGYFQGRSFSVEPALKFGRDNNRCNVVFPVDYPGISGLHCVVTADENGVCLRDQGSSYGTFLAGGTKLAPNQSVSLGSGDTFYLADETNTFEIRIG